MTTPQGRDIIVVDTETTGLHAGVHLPVEVAWVNLTTGEHGRFVPWFPKSALLDADPKAWKVNRYFERGLFDDRLGRRDTVDAYLRLFEQLEGNTLAGANVRFDALMLMAGYNTARDGDDPEYVDEPWHFRLFDLASYTAGVLGIDGGNLPGLGEVCEALGVVNTDAHTALADAVATAELFTRLAERAAVRMVVVS